MRGEFKIAINGLEEFRAALRMLPQHLTDEAAAIVQAHAEQAYREMDASRVSRWNGRQLRGGSGQFHLLIP